jgi:hopanoid biosynthesis associated protein HpnK
MKQLIVNADDFGLTEQVSKGILDVHREGIVTSTTLMANGGAFDAAVTLARRSPRLSVGVHLNLTQGTPVSPPSKIPTLVDGRGRLHLSPSRLWGAITRRQVDLSDIETELRAQISKTRRAGIVPTHLDGHKHVHVLPGVSQIVIRLAKEFDIRYVRCPFEADPGVWRLLMVGQSATPSVIKQYLVARGVSHFAQRFRQKLEEAGLASPAQFYGLSNTGFLNTRSIQDILCRLREGVSELMCHPGYVDGELVKAGTRLLAQREVEALALTARNVKKLVADEGIQLVSYRDLAKPAQEVKMAA